MVTTVNQPDQMPAPRRRRTDWFRLGSLLLNIVLLVRLFMWPTVLDLVQVMPLRGLAFDARQIVWKWADWGTPFSRHFDELVQSNPLAAAVSEADPAWRARAIKLTATAYEQGGWQAANEAMNTWRATTMADTIWVIAHADDDKVLKTLRAQATVYDALASMPDKCVAWIHDVLTTNSPEGSRERAAFTRAFADAYRSGARNLASWGERTPVMPLGATAIWSRWEKADPQLSAAERNFLYARDILNESDADLCARRRKELQKTFSLPPTEAAWLARARWAGSSIYGTR